MRELIFRGKRIEDGEWVISDSIRQLPTGEIQLYDEVKGFNVEVIPETVGQFTGLTDKNGVNIFEGDIVVLNVKGNNTICTVSWAETVAQFQLWQINTIPKTPTALNLGNYDCEIIGNIYNNEDLLQ